MDFTKNVLLPLEPKLLVTLGQIVKRCKLFMKCCTLVSANNIGARECAAHHGMALEPLALIGKIKSGKQNTLKRYTPNSTSPNGANTKFLQIGKRYTPFLALHQFFPTLQYRPKNLHIFRIL